MKLTKRSIYIFFFLTIGSSEAVSDVIDISMLQNRNGIYYEENTGEPYTGQAMELYKSGPKKMEITLVNGKQEGLHKIWYENEQILFESNIKDGIGSAKTYDRKGYLSSEISFDGPIETTKTIHRDKSGNITKEVTTKITLDGNNKVVRDEIIDVNVIDFQSASSLRDIIKGVQVAYYNFIDRYRQIPGDWNKDNAAKKIPGVTTGGNEDGRINDNGNGVWEEVLGVWEHLSKSGLFWKHLATSGLKNTIYKGGTTQPNQDDIDKMPHNPFGGFMMLLRSKDYFDRSSSPKERLLFVIGNGIPVQVLAELGSLIDDGHPQTGVIRNAVISGGILGAMSESSADCVDTTKGNTPIYNITNTQALCNAVRIF